MGNCPTAPMNDAFCNAQELVPQSGGTVFKIGDSFDFEIFGTDGSNIGSECEVIFGVLPVSGTGEPAPKCQVIGDPFNLDFPDPRAGVWYKMTVESDCEVDIQLDTCDTDHAFDTAIAVYEDILPFDCDAATPPNLYDTLQCINGYGSNSSADGGCYVQDLLTDLTVDTVDINGTKTVYVLVYSGNDEIDLDLGIGNFRLEGTVSATPGSKCGGDPHFSRWRQDKHDSFHGECDLVLLHSDKFHDNTGLDVHVRTTMMESGFFSYVDAAAVRIGETVLEFDRDFFRVNGQEHDYDATASFDFEEQGRTYKISSEAMSKTKRETTLKLDNSASIKIRATKSLMYVNFEGSTAAFHDSMGMLGDYKTGDMYGRNGELFEEDYLQYGFEWQVDPHKDPVLFTEHRSPQLPYEKCRLPVQAAASSRRRLRADNSAMRDEAVKACQDAKTDFDLCVDDVMATGDAEAAEMFM